jgi:small subunit ribosomal protein S2
MVDFPKFTVQEMLECGVHFGHRTRAWNPKMAPFIYGARNNLHIMNLQKTVPMLFKSLKIVDELIQEKQNAKILFVGTKRQASASIKEFALRCGQFYVNHRWLGGMLTNWPTISKSIATLENLEKKIKSSEESEEVKYSKKELLDFTRKKDKLELVLGGIRKMKGKPDLMIVIDTKKETIAIKEAQKLGVPIIAIVDSNSDPDGIDHIIPGNDDSRKSIDLYCSLFSDVVLHSLGKSLERSGVSLDGMQEKGSTQGKLEQEMLNNTSGSQAPTKAAALETKQEIKTEKSSSDKVVSNKENLDKK